MTTFLKIINGVPRHVAFSASSYEADYTVTSTITTGTPITLPSSGTYTDIDLEVFLNGHRMYAGVDYNYIGTPPRSQISFTFDLLADDVVKFRRNP